MKHVSVFFLVLVYLVSSANIIDCIHKTEILLKVAFNTNNLNPMIRKVSRYQKQ